MTKLTENTIRQKRHWMADNKGALARIARELNLTAVFVGDVYWGRRNSRGNQVESRLAKLGAPGFQEQAESVR